MSRCWSGARFARTACWVLPRYRLGALKMSDLTVHASHGKRWVGLPARPVLGQDGKPQTDDKGKVRYAAILEWDNRDTGDRFSEAVIQAIEREFPGATSAQ